jgi:GrpB-like predicted nucleotidyltransferase (UPF0157 family)
MKTTIVNVEPYNEDWPVEFEKIKTELLAALGQLADSVEHVGSTSVNGCWAKPIIDVDVVIPSEECLSQVIERLAGVGYYHEGNLGIEGREAFGYVPKPGLMQHHLYVCAKGSNELKRHLAFRDFLRLHPDAVVEYSQVKREAAALYPNDVDAYIQYKGAFIEKIYQQCAI